MGKILVIVESPGKIKKITSILGDEYLVKASVGHIRNLNPKNLSIDVENNFKPEYIIIPDKKKVVADLRRCVKSCSSVILAADEDREGEAIAASLVDVLKLKNPKRIVFNAITKTAILNALKNPGKVDQKLVDAQKTRMILDKIVGYRLSPLLWQNIAHGLSGGRVQSVVVKLVIDREDKIDSFNSESYFKTIGNFKTKELELKSVLYELDVKKSNDKMLKGSLLKLKKEEQVHKILKIFKKSTFTVHNVHYKKTKRNPSPPFITSTLQQEASYKFGFSPKNTMRIAQKLYEGGHITYMRTDSTNLSKEAMGECKTFILKKYGEKYYKSRVFKSKSKNAQEAHEAIRPTHVDKLDVGSTSEQKRLYNLIWRRSVASQMSPAEMKHTIIQIEISHKKKIPYYFETSIEVITFDGFLRVYNLKNKDAENEQVETTASKIPKKGEVLKRREITSTQEYSKSIGRYNEATLVKDLEKNGIGRPSTFANIITKIQKKEYVVKKNLDGAKKTAKIITLKEDNIKIKEKQVTMGKEKNKLVPTEIGRQVTKYLSDNFVNVMNYKFTATLENLLDKIAVGKVNYLEVLNSFYEPFNNIYEKLKSTSRNINNGRFLGVHPKLEWKIYATKTKYGNVIKMFRETKDGNISKDIRYTSIEKPYKLDDITLEQALSMMQYPKQLGRYNDNLVELCKGRYGLYLKCNSKNYPVKEDNVDLHDAIEIIKEKDVNNIRELKIANKLYEIKNGKYGPYISYSFNKKKKFASIPKSMDPKSISSKEILELVEKNNKNKKRYVKSK